MGLLVICKGYNLCDALALRDYTLIWSHDNTRPALFIAFHNKVQFKNDHSVWKLSKKSYFIFSFYFLAFSANFWPIKTDLSTLYAMLNDTFSVIFKLSEWCRIEVHCVLLSKFSMMFFSILVFYAVGKWNIWF